MFYVRLLREGPPPRSFTRRSAANPTRLRDHSARGRNLTVALGLIENQSSLASVLRLILFHEFSVFFCCFAPGVSILKDVGSSRRCSGCASKSRKGDGDMRNRVRRTRKCDERTQACQSRYPTNEPKLGVRQIRNARNEPRSDDRPTQNRRNEPSRGETRRAKHAKRSHDW